MDPTTTEPQPATPAAPEIAPSLRRACDIATGRAEPDEATESYSIRAAHKDYNARGSCREHWYRMVWRGGWQYFGDGRLPTANFLASDRRASVMGDVFPGEVVIGHDRGGPIDLAWLVTCDAEDPAKPLRKCQLARVRAGLKLTLPDGSEIVRPDPRQGGR